MKKALIMFVLIFFIFFLGGCQSTQEEQDNEIDVLPDTGQVADVEQVSVYTTIYPLAFIAESIGGEYVEVESILPAGSDAHSFEPTSKMMVNIAEADLFIYNDEISESYAHTIKEALLDEGVRFLEASKGLDKIHYHHSHEHEEDDDHHDHGDLDPHVWISPNLMHGLAQNILIELIELMPEKQDDLNRQYDDLVNRLIELDQKFTHMVEQANDNKILVTHAAYGYWERDYNLEQIAITGVSATEEPSQRQLVNLLDTIENLELKYILFEQNIEPKVAQVIQKEANLEVLTLHNLEVLTTEDIENGEDYFSLMERNIAVLKQALN